MTEPIPEPTGAQDVVESEPVHSTRRTLSALVATRSRIFATMAVAGLLAGLLWWAWAPPRGQAWVIGHHSVLGMTVATLVPLEQENSIAADGRFAILMLALGIAAALIVWRVTPLRGALTVLVLAVGGV